MDQLSRRDFLGAAAAAAVAMRSRAQTRPPNVIFILADDLGYGDLGCYGQQRIATPNIDAMAASGLRFTQAYAGSTVCAPSRCSLMTGLHTGHARIRGNEKTPLQAGDATVAALFRSAGYRTAMFGKWGLGYPGKGGLPNDCGFDEFYGYLDQTHAHSYYTPHIWQNREEVILPQNMGTRHGLYLPDEFTRRSIEFIDKNRDNPFFLYIPTTLPHADNELGRDTGNGMSVPSLGAYANQDWSEVERSFAAVVSRLDSDVGKILAQVKRAGIEENTLVIFTSDNGPHSEGGHRADFFHSAGPLRGIKRDLYEGGIRIPMIARWPGRVASGRATDNVVAFWDFLPTTAELLGAARPRSLDGVSFLPTLQGRPQPEHPTLYWEFHEQGFHQAVRQGDWKLVRQGPKFETELFHLKDDPGEQRNLSQQEPAVRSRLEKLFGSERVEP